MVLAEPLQIACQIARIFELLGIRYLVGGSLASSLHGIPRATHDIDIVAEIKECQVEDLAKQLKGTFYADADMIREAIQLYRSFNIIHLATMLKIDVFILKLDVFSQEQMARCHCYQVAEDPANTLYLSSAEDIIVHKLIWYQLGDEISQRQWNDVLGVLQIRHNELDYSYLEWAAKQQGILQLLRRAIAEA